MEILIEMILALGITITTIYIIMKNYKENLKQIKEFQEIEKEKCEDLLVKDILSYILSSCFKFYRIKYNFSTKKENNRYSIDIIAELKKDNTKIEKTMKINIENWVELLSIQEDLKKDIKEDLIIKLSENQYNLK